MNEDLRVVIPALLAFAGTLIAAYLGYRQWKKHGENAQKADYLKEKQTVYKELWEKLEEVHLKLRIESVEKSDFKDLLFGVNSYILKKQLFLEKDDQTLVNQYLQSVYELADAIKMYGDEETQWGFQTSLPGRAPDEVQKVARKLISSIKETEEIRDSLILRFKKIISGI
ncbi:MAG: hypothetical protein ACKVQW_01670 [Pyrinomonadaceae bacterium]